MIARMCVGGPAHHVSLLGGRLDADRWAGGDAPRDRHLQGAVAGFGFSLANACDLAFASEDAYFASAYLQIAVTPDGPHGSSTSSLRAR